MSVETPVVVLLVDDEEDISSGIADYINHKYKGFFDAHAIFGKDEIEARTLDLAKRSKPDVVVMDLVLNCIDGVTLTTRLKDRFPEMEVLFLTGCPQNDELRQRAEETGFPSLLKPCNGREVVAKLKEILEK